MFNSLTPASQFYSTGSQRLSMEPVYPLSGLADPYTLRSQRQAIVLNAYHKTHNGQMSAGRSKATGDEASTYQARQNDRARVRDFQPASRFSVDEYKRLGTFAHDALFQLPLIQGRFDGIAASIVAMRTDQDALSNMVAMQAMGGFGV